MAASKVKVAAVFLDLESSLQKARALIEQAAAEGPVATTWQSLWQSG